MDLVWLNVLRNSCTVPYLFLFVFSIYLYQTKVKHTELDQTICLDQTKVKQTKHDQTTCLAKN